MNDVTDKIPEKIQQTNIEDEMRSSFLDYAMSVIISRALPNVRDGLKPVHRRVLFAMHELGNVYNRPYKKSARIVGDVIGKYHPHGDQAVYDTLVRMAQDFSMRQVLVDGQGNFGSVDGDPPAAMRYTEVRMSKLANELLADLEKDTVDFAPNYDGSLTEPQVFPARFPNLLLNGTSGIAVGMATNIPPHNLGEVIDATIAVINEPTISLQELLQHLPGPDFPTGGIVYGSHALVSAYATGRGVIRLRGRVTIEQGKKGERIVIHEIPYQVNKASLIEKIAELVRDKRVEGISDIRDESDREGLCIVIELKRDANAEVIVNQLYAHTSLQTSFGYNMLAIVEGEPRILGLKVILEHFIDHRREVVLRRTRFELKEAEKRFNVVFGLLAAIDTIDRIIQLIRGAPDQSAAKAALLNEKLVLGPAFKKLCQELMQDPETQTLQQAGSEAIPPLAAQLPAAQNWLPHSLQTFYVASEQALTQGYVRLNEAQAQAILDMRLARLTGLEQDKLATEARELKKTMLYLHGILASEATLLKVITQELLTIKEQYAEPRRTELVLEAHTFSTEDLIPEEEVVVTVSHAGYVKRNPIALYQAQRRGGRGKTAAGTRDEDFVSSIFIASTHSYVLVFTDRGKVYWLKVYEIPQSGRTSLGTPIINLVKMSPGERIAALLPVREFTPGRFLVLATAKGYIKKTDLMAFANPRPSGLIALTIDEGDKLIDVGCTKGDLDILLATREGMAIRFAESDVRQVGRGARGVKGITLKKADDAVVGMVIIDGRAPDILTLCANGYGKRTAITEYRPQGRGGSGIINCKITAKNAAVMGICGVTPEDEVMVITDRGMMIRVPVKEISLVGRATQGVRVITVAEGEAVSSLARIAESTEKANDELGETTSAEVAAGESTE